MSIPAKEELLNEVKARIEAICNENGVCLYADRDGDILLSTRHKDSYVEIYMPRINEDL
jgi:hypothetical protein